MPREGWATLAAAPPLLRCSPPDPTPTPPAPSCTPTTTPTATSPAQVSRAEVPDWVLTTFLSNCMQDTNTSQVGGCCRCMGRLSNVRCMGLALHGWTQRAAWMPVPSVECRGASPPPRPQDAGRQSRQVKLLCACVSLVLQRQPATLGESLPELLAFCIQVRRGARAALVQLQAAQEMSQVAQSPLHFFPPLSTRRSTRGTSRPRSCTAPSRTWSDSITTPVSAWERLGTPPPQQRPIFRARSARRLDSYCLCTSPPLILRVHYRAFLFFYGLPVLNTVLADARGSDTPP